jgi:hypothetical protein
MRKLLLGALVALAFAGNSFASFIVYDAKTQFSNASNPNGVWSYGYSDNQTSAIQTAGFNSFTDGFATGFRVNGDYTPGVWKVNNSNFGVQTGDFVLHPGRVGGFEKYGVIRFTATAAGLYNLNLDWVRKGTSANPTGTKDIHVYAFRSGLGAPLVDQNYDYQEVGSYSQNLLNLAAGETIDLRVGGLGQSNGDTTVVGFKVTAVPEPSSLACVSGLVAGLSVLSRRRRQA